MNNRANPQPPAAHLRSDLPPTVQGVVVPSFLYGTAWKEERTEALTLQALAVGFRGVDTANQRRHYVESAVGAAVGAAVAAGTVTRAELFLQTKFTHQAGQDHRLPYDPDAPLEVQVAESFESSLAHLGTDYVDCYVLHGPSARQGLPAEDWEVWRAMERLARGGRARTLGVSNVSAGQLAALWEGAEVKPVFVQNRCYATLGWDRQVRAYCAAHDLLYQGFSLLTANAPVLGAPLVERAAARLGCSTAQVIFRFALEVGMVPLTGSTSRLHLEQALACLQLALTPEEVRGLERIAG